MAKKTELTTDGLMAPSKTPEERNAETKAQLDKYGLKPVSKVEVEDPLTGEKRIVSLDRTGTTEAKLITTLADPELSRDRKDFAVSMYLFERGKESASFITDLVRYKGAHTRETRVFKSQMRFDFEALVDMLAGHMKDQALRVGPIFGIDFIVVLGEYKAWLELDENKGKGRNVKDWLHVWLGKGHEANQRAFGTYEAAILSQAFHDYEFADALIERRRKITAAREAEKGKGIYLDASGKPYLHDDPELDEALARDRELTKEAQKHD